MKKDTPEMQQNSSSPESDSSGEDVKKDFKGLVGSSRKFIAELMNIRRDTDEDATKEAIIADIPFKGHTAWILVCSIFIASVGLNANSTAVVIGAMLISPLMGPILGIGMSLAINDIDTLRRSLKNFAVMVVLSVLTAYLFFAIFPLSVESSELLARTAPDIRDVLIAFFGGLALVIARAKKGTLASVIYGVAIATALMPPLCTVGFGLAIGNLKYASGAMYLFTINTIFIALATFLVLKFLRFPMVRYANSKRRGLIARVSSVVAILVMIPAGFTFYNVFEESRFMAQAQQLLKETVAVYQFNGGGHYMEGLTEVTYDPDGQSNIEVVIMGDELIAENVIDSWRARKDSFTKLRETQLRVVQGGASDSEVNLNYVNELYESKKAELLSKDERIKLLEEELSALSEITSRQIPFQGISAEARANYENLASLAFAYTIRTDFNKLDTIPLFEAGWKEGISSAQIEEERQKLNAWLKIRLDNERIVVRQVSN